MGRMVWGGRHVQPGPSTGAARRLADERSEREELQRGPGREARTLLDVVVRQSAAVLELLASEDQALLVGRDALLVLDLGLDVIDRVRGLDLKGDGLASERLDEDLHGADPRRFLPPQKLTPSDHQGVHWRDSQLQALGGDGVCAQASASTRRMPRA